jgi:hypothetical protein
MRTSSIVLLFVFFGAAGCSPSSTPTLQPVEILSLETNRGAVQYFESETTAATFQDDQEYSLTELSARAPLVLKIKSTHFGTLRVNGVFAYTNSWISVPVTSIGVDDFVSVEYVNASGEARSFKIHTRPKGLPTPSVIGNTSIPGEIALTPGGPGFTSYLLLLSGKGEVIFYRKAPDTQASDFKKYRVEGKTFYTYVTGRPVLPIGYFEGKVHVLNDRFTDIGVVDGALPNLAKGRSATIQSENHDFLFLGTDHYIVSTYYGRPLDNVPGVAGTALIVSSLLQEVVNGSVVFEWDSADHPELYLESEEGNNFNDSTWSDYAHFNSIDIDPRDDNLIVSFRNLNAILKIDRHTGDILWRFGGTADSFGLTAHQIPQGQHSARLTATYSLLYLDNNTTCSGVPPMLSRFYTPSDRYGGVAPCDQRPLDSRIVRVQLNEASKQVIEYQEWRFPNRSEVAAFSGTEFESVSYRGSVQELPNGNFFVGFGSHHPGERDAMEMDSNGNTVFELSFNNAGLQPQQASVSSYRAQFFAD